MKALGSVLLVLISIAACVHTKSQVAYMPNPANITNPIETIKSTIEQQPAAYAYMPVAVEVDEKCIKLYMVGSPPPHVVPIGNALIVGQGDSYVTPESICYKNIGKLKLFQINNSSVWRIEINDRAGEYMYWVYAYDRADAERFLDAITSLFPEGKKK
jgi:hypothetical protein